MRRRLALLIRARSVAAAIIDAYYYRWRAIITRAITIHMMMPLFDAAVIVMPPYGNPPLVTTCRHARQRCRCYSATICH